MCRNQIASAFSFETTRAVVNLLTDNWDYKHHILEKFIEKTLSVLCLRSLLGRTSILCMCCLYLMLVTYSIVCEISSLIAKLYPHVSCYHYM